MKNGVKGLVMVILAYFLYSRISNGTLFFYINNRFAWLTVLAVIGFFVVALGYLYRARLVSEGPAHGEDHNHDHGAHAHDHGAHDHSHDLTRAGLLLVMLPVILGLLVPARPLGATAVGNREVSLGGLSSAMVPKESTLASANREKNLLDWLIAFDGQPDPTAFDGQTANLVGFVYRDSRFADNTFMLSRFIVSCCVADATAIGLIVQSPQAASLATDQWVEVTGRFEAGVFDGQSMPILAAEQVVPTTMPNQPYLFP